jgi:hypothetical protein
MSTCEKCNATFTPATDATEVTSTRNLCTKCEAERRAERLKRAAAASAAPATQPAAASRSSAVPARDPAPREGAPPVPAAQKRPATSAPSSAAARPASSTNAANASAAPASKPAASGARSSATTGASSPSGSGVRSPSASAPKSPAGSDENASAPATKPAASMARSAASAPSSARSARTAAPATDIHEPKHKPIPGARGAAPVHPDVRREAEMLRQRANKTMTYAWIACGVLAVVAAGFVFNIMNKKSQERAAIEAEAKRESDFLAKVKALDVDNEPQSEEALKVAEGDKWWRETAIAGDVGSIITRRHAYLDFQKDKKEVSDRLTNAEIVVKDFASKPPDELAKVRRTLDDLEGKGDMMGDDFKKRVAAAKSTIDRAYITRLHDEAKTQASAGAGNARVALTAYTKAEEEALKQFEKNIRGKQKEAEEYFKAHFLDIIKESDALTKVLFTPEEIAKTPWTDLLSPDQKKHWQQDGFKGWRIENGVLDAAGPEPGTGKVALMDIPDAGGYRDFQLECEFTIVKGSATLCFRLGRRVDRQVEQYLIDAGPKSTAFKAGQSYTALVTFVGSKISIQFTPADAQPYENEVRWDITRKGAFGITLGEGSEMKITKLRIRELR